MSQDWVNRENELFIKVKNIVNKWDMYTLLVMGAPENEYEDEIIDILNRCSFVYSIKSMIINLKSIFGYWSSEKFTDENFEGMAEELVELFITENNKNWYID